MWHTISTPFYIDSEFLRDYGHKNNIRLVGNELVVQKRGRMLISLKSDALGAIRAWRSEYINPYDFHAHIAMFPEYLIAAVRNSLTNQSDLWLKFVAHDVNMGEIAIAGPDSEKFILLSGGAGPCKILSIHNPRTKIGILTHITPCSDLVSLHSYINLVNDHQPLTAKLVSGVGSTRLVGEIGKVFEAYSNITVDDSLVGESHVCSLNTRTGGLQLEEPLCTIDLGANHQLSSSQYFRYCNEEGYQQKKDTFMEAPVFADTLRCVYDGVGNASHLLSRYSIQVFQTLSPNEFQQRVREYQKNAFANSNKKNNLV